MFTVYDCLVREHDLKLVLLAVVICAIASFAAIHLLHHVGNSQGTLRKVWLGVASIATGFGIWAMHFIAMLAYAPDIQSGYNIALTITSLIAAILFTAISLSVASSSLKLGRWIGGALVGGGIAVMHYTGMAAFEAPGIIEWTPSLVVASILLGALFGALAIPAGLRSQTYRSIALGALLLTVAICSLHFTAMAAATLTLDPNIAVSPHAISTYRLATMVTFACCAIFFLTFAGFALDLRKRRLVIRELEKLSSLANAAFEGLLLCEGNLITTANESLAALVGSTTEQLRGIRLAQILPDKTVIRLLQDRPCTMFETVLQPIDGGDLIAVEATARPIVYARKLQRVVAIRDLRGRRKAEREIHYLAHHDTLTGLANRQTFNQELNRQLQIHRPGGSLNGRHLAVLHLGLDHFQEVNDLFGQAAGDSLLKNVARSAQQVLRKGQLMARLGGDEFAIVVPCLSDPQQAERIAKDLFAAFHKDNRRASSSSTMISTSIGIAVFPQDADDSASLLSCADTALRMAKAEGRGHHCYFEASMGEQLRDRRRMEHELRFAIQQQELSLMYQPQVRVSTREIIGFEALLRWQHKERGNVPPTVFIPIAEECGLIQEIGEWVLRQACQEAARWERPLQVAVNVSALQLHNSRFVQVTREALRQTGLAPSHLELEITETALIRDQENALRTLHQLKGLGVRIAMDDFGTGYSSLSYLRAFPFDKIKIDASFIKSVHANRQAATIVRLVLGLGRGLDLPVLAEGVETEDELTFLREESCQEAQGYLFGKPQAIDAFRHLTMDAK